MSPSVVVEEETTEQRATSPRMRHEGEFARVVSEVGCFCSSGGPLTLHNDFTPAVPGEGELLLLPTDLLPAELSTLPRSDVMRRDVDTLRSLPRAEVVLQQWSTASSKQQYGRVLETGTSSMMMHCLSDKSSRPAPSHQPGGCGDRGQVLNGGCDQAENRMLNVEMFSEPPPVLRRRANCSGSTLETARLAVMSEAVSATTNDAVLSTNQTAAPVELSSSDFTSGWKEGMNLGLAQVRRRAVDDGAIVPDRWNEADQWRGRAVEDLLFFSFMSANQRWDRAVADADLPNGHGGDNLECVGAERWRGRAVGDAANQQPGRAEDGVGQRWSRAVSVADPDYLLRTECGRGGGVERLETPTSGVILLLGVPISSLVELRTELVSVGVEW